MTPIAVTNFTLSNLYFNPDTITSSAIEMMGEVNFNLPSHNIFLGITNALTLRHLSL